MTNWNTAQKWEKRWHQGIGANTFNEERKQFVYAKKMGIEVYSSLETPYNIKNYGKILDIGGGEASLLLKVINPTGCVVVDPCKYPKWISERYKEYGITLIKEKAEDWDCIGFDEVWIYNCLQHCEDPEKICKNALKAGKLVRVFEWVENGISPGHLHNLTEKDLNKWLEGEGKVERVDESGCNGLCYFGIFMGKQ